MNLDFETLKVLQTLTGSEGNKTRKLMELMQQTQRKKEGPQLDDILSLMNHPDTPAFSDQETEQILAVLRSSMTPQQQAQIERLRLLSAMLQKRAGSAPKGEKNG